jgi:hypothetical protein
MKRARVALLLLGVAVAASFPLFGDPRGASLGHPEWARMVLRALDLEDFTDPRSDEMAFAALAWTGSLAFAADHYVRGDNVETVTEGKATRVLAGAGAGEVGYTLSIARGGDYTVRLRSVGPPGRPLAVELARPEEKGKGRTFTLAPPPVLGWADVGTAHLDTGVHSLSVLLPASCSLASVEVIPPCLSPVEPLGGWRSEATTSTEDAAVTVVKALDAEGELPPADLAIEAGAPRFRESVVTVAAAAGGQDAEMWMRAGTSPREAVLVLDVPTDGLYAISAFAIEGEGQRWLVDSCHKAVLCPPPAPVAPGWRYLMAARLAAGQHSFAVQLAPGAAFRSLRLERKKETGEDYVATLRRLGFDVGPTGPIARGRAEEAAELIRKRRVGRSAGCGDLVPFDHSGLVTVAGLPQVGFVRGPGVPPLPSGPAPVAVPPPPEDQLPASTVVP